MAGHREGLQALLHQKGGKGRGSGIVMLGIFMEQVAELVTLSLGVLNETE